HTRHVEIEQDQIWLPVAEDLERLGSTRRGLHVAPLDRHEDLDHLAEAILVFDDEDAPRLIRARRGVAQILRLSVLSGRGGLHAASTGRAEFVPEDAGKA